MNAVDALRTEVDTLRETVARLEQAMRGGEWRAPVEWGLTRHQHRIMGALVARAIASRDTLMLAVYGGMLGESPCEKIIDVQLVKVRQKVRPFGWTIHTKWGQGWYLPADQRTALAAGAVANAQRATPEPMGAAHA